MGSEDISTWEGWACDKWGTNGEHMRNNRRISATHSCLRFGLSDPEPVATSGLSEELGPQALGALDELSKQGDGESVSHIEARQLV